ncbi:MAG TPA: hypothetical protein VFM18_08460, partial [Methanosarcina sp.]|nr:hypothetical protein [Methanosarcina sp.]
RKNAAMDDFNRTISKLKDASVKSDLKIEVTHVKCGVKSYSGYYGETINSTEFVSRDITYVYPMTTYETTGGNTPLFKAIRQGFSMVPDDGSSPVLVSIVTDGEDNVTPSDGSLIAKEILKRQDTDRWTVAFSVPKGYKEKLARLGIPDGNIQEWELSSAGMETASISRGMSLNAYTSSVASGNYTSTTKFYTDLSNVDQTTIKNTLVDISQQVMIFPVSGAEGQQIRAFVESKINKKMKTGSAFYQLVKSEAVVQPNKLILVRDKKTNAIYAGDSARDLLNLPRIGNIKLVPGNHGNYDLFVQSTSVNRKLDANTQLIYWENFTNNPVHNVYNVPTLNVVAPTLNIVKPAKSTNVIDNVLKNIQPVQVTAADHSKNQLAGYLDALSKANIIDSKKKKTPAKKTVLASKKSVPATKKRIRNRWTTEELVRREILAHANTKIAVKKMTNKVDLEKTLGYSKGDLVILTNALVAKFNTTISAST